MTIVRTMFVGVARSIPDVTTFVMPIFSNGDENYMSQEIENGVVIGFRKIFVGEEFQSLSYKIVVEVGDPALYGFEVYSDSFLVGPAPLVAKIIDIWKNMPDSKARLGTATAAAIERFLDFAQTLKTQLTNNFVPVIFAQRKFSSHECSIRFMDEITINLIRSNNFDGDTHHRNIFDLVEWVTPILANKTSSLRALCEVLRIPMISTTGLIGADELLFQHVQFKAGQRVHTIGQTFDALYVVHSGFLKTVLIDEYGNEQVLSFPMKADILGVDGINSKLYSSEAVALSDCDLILLPFEIIIALARTHVELENAIYDVLSRELVREQEMVNMLGALSAEARVARFLVSLAERFAQMDYSSKFFNFRMTRHEIGSYLGLTVDTVNRTLSKFNEIGLISIDQFTIAIKNSSSLKILCHLPSKVEVSSKKITASTPKNNYYIEQANFLLEGNKARPLYQLSH